MRSLRKPYFKHIIVQEDKRHLLKDKDILFTELGHKLEALLQQDSMEKDMAIMSLQQAAMWFGRALAMDYKVKIPKPEAKFVEGEATDKPDSPKISPSIVYKKSKV